MALSIRGCYKGLQDQLEVLRDRGYYYIGEHIFTGSYRERNKINVDVFHDVFTTELYHIAITVQQQKLQC